MSNPAADAKNADATSSRTALESKFGADTPASEVIKGIDLKDRVVLITGGSAGLGLETARALASAKAHVLLAVRNVEAAKAAIDDLKKTTGNDKIEALAVDLGDLDSVVAFAAKFNERKLPLDVLVNNAGIMGVVQSKTKQGFESHFGVNHLGHFLLTLLLLPALQAGHKRSGKSSRVVSLSSGGHHWSDVHWDDIQYASRTYERLEAYGQSKTCNILFAKELHRRFASSGVTANAVHPGTINTNLAHHLPDDYLISKGFKDKDGKWLVTNWKTVQAGAATSVLVASSPTLEGKGCFYFEDCQIGLHVKGTRKGPTPFAESAESAAKLWKLSVQLLRDYINEKKLGAELFKLVE